MNCILITIIEFYSGRKSEWFSNKQSYDLKILLSKVHYDIQSSYFDLILVRIHLFSEDETNSLVYRKWITLITFNFGYLTECFVSCLIVYRISSFAKWDICYCKRKKRKILLRKRETVSEKAWYPRVIVWREGRSNNQMKLQYYTR